MNKRLIDSGRYFGVALLAAIGLLLSGHGNAIADPSPDVVGYLNAIHADGIVPNQGFTNQDLIDAGFAICQEVEGGKSRYTVAQQLLTSSTIDTIDRAEAVVDDATTNLCPKVEGIGM